MYWKCLKMGFFIAAVTEGCTRPKCAVCQGIKQSIKFSLDLAAPTEGGVSTAVSVNAPVLLMFLMLLSVSLSIKKSYSQISLLKKSTTKTTS